MGVVLQEGTEPGKCQATNSQLGEPPQENTMVDGIKGGRDIKEDQQGYIAPIGFPQQVIQQHDQCCLCTIVRPEA